MSWVDPNTIARTLERGRRESLTQTGGWSGMTLGDRDDEARSQAR